MLLLPETVGSRVNDKMTETLLSVVFTILGIFAHLSSAMHYYAILSAFGVSAFSIWDLTTNFVTWAKTTTLEYQLRIKMNDLGYAEEIKGTYFKLHDTIQAINNMWTGLFLWCIMYACARLSAGFYLLMKTDNYSSMIVQIAELVTFFVAIVLSAEGSRKVTALNLRY